MSGGVFQQELEQAQHEREAAERAKVLAETERTRLASEVQAERGEANRLRAALDQADSEIAVLERKLGDALAEKDQVAEIVRERDRALTSLATAEGELEEARVLAADRANRIEALEDENALLGQEKHALERELAPTRALIEALKDRQEVERRIAEEIGVLNGDR